MSNPDRTFALALVGAVNTVVIRDGRLVGHNTDASGFLAGLRGTLPDALSDPVVLLGAGGAGSAIGYAVLEAATPVGIESHPGLPLQASLVRPDLWMADVVYVPLDTALVRLARARGCPVVDGGGMAVHEALGAFELFTGRPADAVRVREHFARLLAARDGPPGDARPPA